MNAALSSKGLALAEIDSAIVHSTVPELYVVIDDLLDYVRADVPKELLIRAKKLLPNWAPHSFEQSPLRGMKQ